MIRPCSSPQTPRTIRIAAYIRVGPATAADPLSTSLTEQRFAIWYVTADEESRGWVCLPPYEDIGYSAGNLRRRALRRLVADTKAGKIDCVMVYSLDRLVRSHCVQEILASIFRRFGVPVLLLTPTCHFWTG